ncbi:MAG: HEAT repeat domain-containing protein [Phycisphaerales bacterium]|nr:HEAT repeat domain-containing protein [Phycisphaerales bacterium]
MAVAVAVIAGQACAQVAEAPPTDAVGLGPVQAQRERITLYRNVLYQEAMSADDRRRAVLELLGVGWEDALYVLSDALDTTLSDGVILAIADGIATSATPLSPPPPLLPSLLDALTHASPATRPALIRAVTAYSPDDVVPPLKLAAQQADAPVGERVGPIAALGHIRTDEAIDTLISLLDDDQPKAVRDHAMEALETTTGITHHHDDPDGWRQWWAQNRDVPREERLADLITSLSGQIAERDRHIERINNRLAEVIRQLYTMTPAPRRSSLLAELLADQEQCIREAAMDLVELAMGDAVALDAVVNEALRRLVNDANPAFRARAARILLNLADDRIGPLVAEALPGEAHPLPRGEFLSVLARSPQPGICDHLVQLIADPQWRQAASSALLTAADADLVTAEQQQRAAATLRAVEPADLPPAAARLQVRFGTDADRAELLTLLSSAQPEVKREVARGLARKPEYVETLLSAADDPAVYPSAVDAIVSHRTGRPAVDALLSLPPIRSEQTTMWRDAFTRVTQPLSSTERLAVDDWLLSSAGPLVAADARELLLVALETSGDAPPAEQIASWVELTIRLASIRAEQGRLSPAAALLDRIRPHGPASDDYIRVQLTVWLAQGQYDAAAELGASPAQWLNIAQWASSSAPDSAAPLLTDIQRRFADVLSDAEKQHLAQLAEECGLAEPPADEVPADEPPTDEANAPVESDEP